MKHKKLITAAIIIATLVVSISQTNVNLVKGADLRIPSVTKLIVRDYYAYTGKYFIYFNQPEESNGFNIYIDNSETPIKTVTSSGSYLDAKDLENVPDGTHVLYVANVGTDGEESERVSTTINISGNAGNYNDIPQIYINTDTEITKDYHTEKDVTISVVDKTNGSGKDIIETAGNIKIRGNSTSSADKKPWNIKFNSKVDLLKMGKGKKWCLLANAYDKSLMRNHLVYQYGVQTGMEFSPDSRYVEVYLNGLYQGNYLLSEPIEVKKERVDIDAYNADNNDILLELGTRYESDVNHFKTSVLNTTFDVNDPEKDGDLDSRSVLTKISRVKTYLNEFEATLQNGTYKDILNYIDEDSFVDFYIANEYFKNADFNFSSTRFYIKGDKIYGGPLWDFDLSCGNLNPRTYADYYVNGKSYEGYRCREMNWYRELFKHAEFEEKVKRRFKQLQFVIQNIYRSDSPSELSINYYINQYGESIKRDSSPINELGAGWSLSGGGGYVGISYTTTAKWTQWEQPVSFLRDWLDNRNRWLCNEWNIDMQTAYEESDPDNIQYYSVKIDGQEVKQVIGNDLYRLPSESTIGYCADGKIYKPGSEITITQDMNFTKVKLLLKSKGILSNIHPAEIRFTAKIDVNSNEAIDNCFVEEGFLISTDYLVSDYGKLTLDSKFKYVRVKNNGWYQNNYGTYSVRLTGISTKNYGMDYSARAYVVVKYADDEIATVYSNYTVNNSVMELLNNIRTN